jgi:hypothetical protein
MILGELIDIVLHPWNLSLTGTIRERLFAAGESRFPSAVWENA